MCICCRVAAASKVYQCTNIEAFLGVYPKVGLPFGLQRCIGNIKGRRGWFFFRIIQRLFKGPCHPEPYKP